MGLLHDLLEDRWCVVAVVVAALLGAAVGWYRPARAGAVPCSARHRAASCGWAAAVGAALAVALWPAGSAALYDARYDGGCTVDLDPAVLTGQRAWVHLVGVALLVLAGVLVQRHRAGAVALGAATATVLVELAQAMVPWRSCTTGDMAFGLLGVGAGALVALAVLAAAGAGAHGTAAGPAGPQGPGAPVPVRWRVGPAPVGLAVTAVAGVLCFALATTPVAYASAEITGTFAEVRAARQFTDAVRRVLGPESAGTVSRLTVPAADLNTDLVASAAVEQGVVSLTTTDAGGWLFEGRFDEEVEAPDGAGPLLAPGGVADADEASAAVQAWARAQLPDVVDGATVAVEPVTTGAGVAPDRWAVALYRTTYGVVLRARVWAVVDTSGRLRRVVVSRTPDASVPRPALDAAAVEKHLTENSYDCMNPVHTVGHLLMVGDVGGVDPRPLWQYSQRCDGVTTWGYVDAMDGSKVAADVALSGVDADGVPGTLDDVLAWLVPGE